MTTPRQHLLNAMTCSSTNAVQDIDVAVEALRITETDGTPMQRKLAALAIRRAEHARTILSNPTGAFDNHVFLGDLEAAKTLAYSIEQQPTTPQTPTLAPRGIAPAASADLASGPGWNLSVG